jgi:hypothetical protein
MICHQINHINSHNVVAKTIEIHTNMVDGYVFDYKIQHLQLVIVCHSHFLFPTTTILVVNVAYN